MTGPARYPGALWQPLDPSDGADYGGALTSSRGLVLHVQAGDHDPGPWFDRPDVPASSHWWASKAGVLKQYLPADRQSWAQAGGNSGWHSVETEGLPGQPLTAAQIDALGRLMRWGHATWGWPLQLTDSTAGTGLGTHGMGGAAWGGHTGCPGPIRSAQRADILAAVRGLTGGVSASTTGDDVELAEFKAAGKAPGKDDLVQTIVAGCVAAETAVNRANDAKAAAAAAAAAAARIEAFIGSLSGNLVGPPTAGEILDALPGLARGDQVAIGAAVMQLLARPA